MAVTLWYATSCTQSKDYVLFLNSANGRVVVLLTGLLTLCCRAEGMQQDAGAVKNEICCACCNLPHTSIITSKLKASRSHYSITQRRAATPLGQAKTTAAGAAPGSHSRAKLPSQLLAVLQGTWSQPYMIEVTLVLCRARNAPGPCFDTQPLLRQPGTYRPACCALDALVLADADLTIILHGL